MNFRLLSKLLGILTVLIGCFMLFSLIWADPNIGAHTDPVVETNRPETDGIWGLIYSAIICWVLGGLMFRYGRGGVSKIYRKEAMAVVGLSWVSYSTGFRLDLGAASRLCRDNGVKLVIDASQGVGGLPFNVKEVPFDLLTCATYKWLMGPYGLGFSYIGHDLLSELSTPNICAAVLICGGATCGSAGCVSDSASKLVCRMGALFG